MKCPQCQHENRSGAKFCEECAIPLARTCANCGSQVSATAKFCPECAHPVAGAAPQPRFASPEGYTPKHLAERILTSRAALEGERKLVTVLFADLKGSMELLADRDPEEARKILDPVLQRMMEAVHRYEGTVNQVMGDGIMALFGAPLAHEDHAVRACYAALRMQESVKRYADEVFRSQGVPIQIRLGLNSGEVVVRAIGSDLHMDYTAVGQTTHLAARMEQMATPGTILLAPATLELAEGYVQVAARGPVAVKGLPGPVEFYELRGASAVHSRLQAAAARGFTRFVGRDPEIEQFRRALALAQDGHGQLVAIVGEPGVGKSRLVYEFMHSRSAKEWLILEAGSVSYGKATPYLPVIDLLKSYSQIESRDDHGKMREKVTGKLLTLDRTLEPLLPAFLALLDVPVEDAQWQALDPPQRRRYTLDAVKRLLLRESQVQPVIVLFEDLHWIDSETQALLETLVESLPPARILVLVTYRPEYQHAWGGKTYYSQARIDPLPPENAKALLDGLLGSEGGLQPLKRLLIERTEGNPFFLEESVRTLIEAGALTGERRHYRLARDLGAIQVPATVQAILAARIDGLSHEDKRLLQAASVVGKDFPLALLRAVTEEDEDALRQGLTRLQAAEFLYGTKLFPDPEYTFKHALTHEVAYGSMLHDRRRALHARIVGAIEALYPDRRAEQVERLAHHAFRGEIWDKVVHYAWQAADRAAALCADSKAIDFYELALDALGRVPDPPGSLNLGLDIRLAMRAPLWRSGRLEPLFKRFKEAEALAARCVRTESLDTIYAFLVQYHWAKGEQEQAIEYGRHCLEAAEARNDLALRITGHLYLCHAYHAKGQFAAAIQQAREIIARLEGPQEAERFGLSGLPYCGACAFGAQCLSELGDTRAALELISRGARVADAAKHLYSQMAMTVAHGYVLLRRGTIEEAELVLEPAVKTCREKNFAGQLIPALTMLGHAYTLAGRPAEGIPLVKEAVARHEKLGAFARRAYWLYTLAAVYLHAGQLNQAEATAQDALGFAARHGEQWIEGWTKTILAEVASRRSDAQGSEQRFVEAQQIAAELGMRPLVAHCHLGLGKLCRRTGKRQEAHEHLTTATAMYREMDMRFWLEKAKREMSELR